MKTINEINAAILATGAEHVVIEESRTQDWELEHDIISERQEFIRTKEGLELSCSMTESLGFWVEGHKAQLNTKSVIEAIKLAEIDRKNGFEIDDDEVLSFS